jgi:hypothetical protein
MKKQIMLLGAVGLLAFAGCSSDDDATTTAGNASNTSAAAAAPSGTEPVADTGCTTNLELVNTAAESTADLTDRALEVETAWADAGPHPDNTVDYDKSLEAAVAEFAIPVSEQFGYSIPTGSPDAPDGKVYLAFYLSVPEGKIAAGQTFVSSTSDTKADGVYNSYSLYSGSDRLLPGDATITITELSDDQVCGSITSETKTDLQTFVGVEGTFALDRIQALEAADKSGSTTGTTK